MWAAAETWLRQTASRVAGSVREGITWLGDVLGGTGVVAEGLARIPLVRSASTTGAKVAAGVLAVHAISKGMVAAKIVAALPASMDLVIAATNPWLADGHGRGRHRGRRRRADRPRADRQTVHVVAETDGSVAVEGIPASVPLDLREVVARIASDGAVRHMQRTLRLRPTPSCDDRRLFTKAAREALIAEAHRRRHGQERQAA